MMAILWLLALLEKEVVLQELMETNVIMVGLVGLMIALMMVLVLHMSSPEAEQHGANRLLLNLATLRDTIDLEQVLA